MSSPADRFPNGKRLVRWVGAGTRVSYMDAPDPTDSLGRSRRTLMLTGAYTPKQKTYHEMAARIASRWRALPGITTRQLTPEHVPGMSRTYRWGGERGDWVGNAFVSEMDARDADLLMQHPQVSRQFRWADTDESRRRHLTPNPASGLTTARLVTSTGAPPEDAFITRLRRP